MGVYDTVILGGRQGQTKCWEPEGRTFLEHDPVPDIEEGERNYSIAMREGGWVNVEQGYLTSWTEMPVDVPLQLYDKWGTKLVLGSQELEDVIDRTYYENRLDSNTILRDGVPVEG